MSDVCNCSEWHLPHSHVDGKLVTSESDEAVKLARQVVVNDVRDTWSLTSLTLARAVIAQAEELAKLRAALREALDGWASYDRLNQTAHYTARIAELRRLADGE